jgi:hypothetical protein
VIDAAEKTNPDGRNNRMRTTLIEHPAVRELFRLHGRATAAGLAATDVRPALMIVRHALAALARHADPDVRVEGCKAAREIARICEGAVEVERLRLTGATRH